MLTWTWVRMGSDVSPVDLTNLSSPSIHAELSVYIDVGVSILCPLALVSELENEGTEKVRTAPILMMMSTELKEHFSFLLISRRSTKIKIKVQTFRFVVPLHAGFIRF